MQYDAKAAPLERFYGSWADISAQAEAEYGPAGRAVAVLTRALGAGSKRILASYLEEAAALVGGDNPPTVTSILEWAHQPYSSEGLQAAAAAYRSYIAGDTIPLERF